MTIKIGQVCFRTKGRTQGDKVIVLETRKDGFVVIEGIKTKRKPCNPRHLFPTPKNIAIKKGVSHKEIVKLLQATA